MDDAELKDVTFPSETQAIITSYQFQCCGNITEWRTYLQCEAESSFYSFQVWRPANNTECYSLVGTSNYGHFGNGDDKECVDGNLFILTPQPSDVITIKPGDVVDIYVDGERFQLDRSYRGERVWYRTFNLAIF